MVCTGRQIYFDLISDFNPLCFLVVQFDGLPIFFVRQDKRGLNSFGQRDLRIKIFLLFLPSNPHRTEFDHHCAFRMIEIAQMRFIENLLVVSGIVPVNTEHISTQEIGSK